MALIGPPRLAESHVRPGHVEDVVDDLEEHAKLRGELPEARESRRLGLSTQQQYALDARPDQPSCLQFVQAAQRRAAVLGEALDVDVLPADHAVDTGCR